MHKLVLSVMSLFVGLTVSNANASFPSKGSVAACSTDSYTSERIKEDVTSEKRMDVFNAKGEVVGAFEFDPADGELVNLYLCGNNSGHYYAEGNFRKDPQVRIYNDEYDSVTRSTKIAGALKIELSINWVGEVLEDADYGPVRAVIYVKQ